MNQNQKTTGNNTVNLRVTFPKPRVYSVELSAEERAKLLTFHPNAYSMSFARDSLGVWNTGAISQVAKEPE